MIGKKVAAGFIPHFHDDGGHHRAHAISLASLFVYLQLFILVFAGFYFIRIKAPHILGTVSFSAEQIVSLTNTKRGENGLQALLPNSLLSKAAAAKAADMLANDYWAHNSPSGKTPWSFITAAGYRYVFAGENLARDFADSGSVVNAWMNSPSHRSNLLDKNFKEIGVAVADGKLGGREGTLVVQMFGAGVSQIPPPAPLVEVGPSPQSAGAKEAIQAGESPAPEATPVAVVNIGPGTNQENLSQPVTVLASRRFSIAKGVSLGLVSFIFGLFAVEALVTIRRTNVSLKPGVVAHLGFLAFVLFAVWYAVQGAIL